jgi:hypothetical protein
MEIQRPDQSVIWVNRIGVQLDGECPEVMSILKDWELLRDILGTPNDEIDRSQEFHGKYG